MDTKLTLKLDREIIERAKQYAQDKNISLSKLIENMLSKVTDARKFKPEVTPLVDSLSGLIDVKDLDSDDYRNFLDEKVSIMEKVFIDTDIVLDVLAKREHFYEYGAHILSLADKKEIEIAVSSLTFANLNYMLSKSIGSTQTRKVLLQFKTLVEVTSVDNKIIDLALGSDFKDFEDAIQYYCAIENGYTILLTRNLPDYKKAEIPVMTAESYVKS